MFAINWLTRNRIHSSVLIGPCVFGWNGIVCERGAGLSGEGLRRGGESLPRHLGGGGLDAPWNWQV